MKIKVMSKFAQSDPYQLPVQKDCVRTQRRNLNHLVQSSASLAPSSDYFPTASALLPKHRLQGHRGSRVSDFFNHFEANCSVFYERVDRQTPQLCRRLAPLLEAHEFPIAATPPRIECQFSFKKAQDTRSIPRNHFEHPTPPAQQQNNAFAYYLQTSRPKIKLRKFHSLISIKKDSSSVESQQYAEAGTGVRRNQSMVKKEGRIIRLFQGRTDRNHTENEEQGRERTVGRLKVREGVKTEVFEEEKERLTRIRRELNEIYNAKRGPCELRLKLY